MTIYTENILKGLIEVENLGYLTLLTAKLIHIFSNCLSATILHLLTLNSKCNTPHVDWTNSQNYETYVYIFIALAVHSL